MFQTSHLTKCSNLLELNDWYQTVSGRSIRIKSIGLTGRIVPFAVVQGVCKYVGDKVGNRPQADVSCVAYSLTLYLCGRPSIGQIIKQPWSHLCSELLE